MNVNKNKKCPACGGMGWVERRDDIGYEGHVTMVRCPDPIGVHKAAKTARLAYISGLLSEEMAVRLDNIVPRGDTAEMADLARKFVNEPWGFFTLWGGSGNGKTLILQAVVNEFRERHSVVGTYVRMHDLLEYVRAGYAPNARDDARARYEQLKSLPILAIDEFDAARMTDFAYEFRTAFLDDRYRLAVVRRAHTLFAMNCDPEELPGDIYDRLIDGRFVIFRNKDSSMRPAITQ
jgi:DNA replication protein DnaC